MRKKKEEKYIPRTGGLLIGENLMIDVKRSGKTFELIKLWAIAAIGVFATVFSTISLYDIKCNEEKVAMITLIFFAISAFVFSTKRQAVLSAFEIAVMLAIFLLMPKDELLVGFKCFVNCIVDKAELESYGIVGFYVPRKIGSREALTLFMSVFGALTSFLLAFGAIARKNFALCFICTFPIIELGLFFGIAPDYFQFALLLAFWIAIAVLNNSNYCEYVGKEGNDFVRKGNSFMPKYGMKKRVDASSSLCALLLTLMVFGMASFGVKAFDIERSDSVNELRYNLKHNVSDMSLKDIIDMLSGKSPTTNYGNIGSVGNLDYEDKDMLHVQFSNKMNSNIYLKSYVGSVYDSTSWSELDEDALEELGNISSEFEDVCYPQDMLWYFMRLNYDDLPKASVVVDVINAPDDFCYTPYGSVPKNNSQYLTDTAVIVDSVVIGENDYKASYSYDFIPGNFETVIDWYCNPDKEAKALYLDMHRYDDFVFDNYLQLPDDSELMSLYDEKEYSEIFEMYQSGQANMYQTLCAIRELIHSKARYTLSPGTTPNDVDFAYYFLEENNKGYCVHYTTAGVLLARMAGIPARYCVGYVASASKFTLLNKADSGYDFILKDDSSHAWAEIYLEGVGWVPFEFTEGYAQQSQTTTRVSTTTTTVTTTRATTRKSTSQSGTLATTTSTAPAAIDNTDVNPHTKYAVLIIAIVVLILALMVLVMLRSRKVALIRRKKSMKSDCENNNAVNAYRYIVSLLEFDGVSVLNLTPLEHALLAEEKCDYLEKGSLISACRSAMKAGFGGSLSLGLDEAQRICALSSKIADSIYLSKSFSERFKMKYIERLI